jgi:DICT domain-containing protein
MTTPYGLVSATEPAQVADKAELVALSRRMERAALAAPPPVVAATLQDVRYLSERTRDVYTRLAEGGARATLHARGLQAWIAPGVRGVALDDDDPLVDEWVVVLPSPGAPVVFAATDLRQPCDIDEERCFSYAVSRDPAVVQACLDLLVPEAAPGR